MIEADSYFTVPAFANANEFPASDSSKEPVNSHGHLFRKSSLKSSGDTHQNSASSPPADSAPDSPHDRNLFDAKIKNTPKDADLSAIPPATNHKNRVIVRFSYPDPDRPSHNKICNIELPLQITSNDLIVGLNSAYRLGIDVSDARQHYLSCEHPIALLKGNRTLAECGVRDGSLIIFNR